MTMRYLAWLLMMPCASMVLCARETVALQWPTRFAAAPSKWDKPLADWMPMFRIAMTTMPEGTTVSLALSQPALMQLPANAAAKLLPLVARRYEMIAADPAYAHAPSALPYCFSTERPTQGYATLYVPDHPTAQSEPIVFLHGYAGSFLWYLHYLSEAFPDAIIVAPAYGLSGGNMPAEYVLEAMRAAEKRLGHTLATPRLIGLSAGGFGASRVFAAQPDAFVRLEVMAAYPPTEAIARLQKGRTVRVIAGGTEFFVEDGSWETAKRQLKARGVEASFSTIPGADHFFMLTHPKDTKAWLEKR